MVFQSIEYLIFLISVLAVYFWLPRREQNLVIIAASYIFYGWVHPWYLILICITTIFDWVCAIGIEDGKTAKTRKAYFITEHQRELRHLVRVQILRLLRGERDHGARVDCVRCHRHGSSTSPCRRGSRSSPSRACRMRSMSTRAKPKPAVRSLTMPRSSRSSRSSWPVPLSAPGTCCRNMRCRAPSGLRACAPALRRRSGVCSKKW